ncbi:hypothetical protein MtrunA17_Chr7g0250751 [Medicago truncatula]|uniref:Uncharacterized protein n=1 Tax=Medicago truncatula TaxID=3880 RepID=A0A396H1L2_MEDTR|nr:hypothetical protein MtrunA17_Chr7g0250751 [Medicago truncatula]
MVLRRLSLTAKFPIILTRFNTMLHMLLLKKCEKLSLHFQQLCPGDRMGNLFGERN